MASATDTAPTPSSSNARTGWPAPAATSTPRKTPATPRQIRAPATTTTLPIIDVRQARNLVMDLGEQAHRARFMIRDRGANFTIAFDAVLADAGIRTVLCNIQTPRMNAITERWIGGCRRELLDRTIIWNQATSTVPRQTKAQCQPRTSAVTVK